MSIKTLLATTAAGLLLASGAYAQPRTPAAPQERDNPVLTGDLINDAKNGFKGDPNDPSRGVKLTGFMLGRFMARRTPQQIRETYAALAQQVMDGRLYAPVDTVYPIEQIKDALAHADKGGRNGKILVSPNGAI